MARHRLAAGSAGDDVVGIADDLVALHSSDPATVYLSAMARMANPSLAAVSAALYDDRSLVRVHAMRRTIWVLTPAAARPALAGCTADLARKEWRQLIDWVARAGFEDADQYVEQAAELALATLATHGPASARRVGRLAPELAVKITAGNGKWVIEQALHTRLLLALGFDARIIRGAPTGTWLSNEYEWSLTEDWLGGPLVDPAMGADDGRAEIVRRYLERFGPATTSDIAWWMGSTVAAVRQALSAIEAEPCAAEVADGEWCEAWIVGGDREAPDGAGSVVLLPSLDPTAMGWKQRRWCFGDHDAFGGPLFDRNGNVGPTVWVDGRAVGAWAQRSDGDVVHELVVEVPAGRRRQITAASERLRALLGDARVTPRFPAPLQQRLTASP